MFLGRGGIEKKRFQQTRSTHSRAEKKETLNKNLWEKQMWGIQRNIIREAFGPSACRDPFWIVLRSKSSISVGPGDLSSPETSRYRIVEVTLATLQRSKARFVSGFQIASFASNFISNCDRFGINFETMSVDPRLIFRASICGVFILFVHTFSIEIPIARLDIWVPMRTSKSMVLRYYESSFRKIILS